MKYKVHNILHLPSGRFWLSLDNYKDLLNNYGIHKLYGNLSYCLEYFNSIKYNGRVDITFVSSIRGTLNRNCGFLIDFSFSFNNDDDYQTSYLEEFELVEQEIDI